MSADNPRPPWPTLYPAASHTDSSTPEPGPHKAWPLIEKVTRKSIAVAACESCRTRKIKCNAQRPACSACRKRNVRCHYDADPSETPGQALKRKYSQLQDQSPSSSTDKIYKILQMRSEDEALDIFHRIRRGADPDSILRLIENADVMIDLAVKPETRLRFEFPYIAAMPRYLYAASNSYLQSPIYDYAFGDESRQQRAINAPPGQVLKESIPFLRPYHAAAIIDPRLSKIRPSDWTVVSENDHLMRTMLQHFFMYEYQWHASFQKDCFLDDMVSGDRQFCSPLLVNSILAHACHSATEHPNRAEYWNPRTLGYLFMAEAKRLWDMEAGNVRLTTVQAGPILYLAHAICGSDKIGRAYLIQSVAMAKNLAIFKLHSNRVSGKAQDARDFTAWAIFVSQIHNQWYFQDRPLLDEKPEVPLPDPNDNQDWFGEFWLKYPSSDELYPAHFGASFRGHALISVIFNDIACEHYRGQDHKPVFSLRDILGYYKRLENWFDSLPLPLTPRNIIFPVHLKLHMHYYNSVIRLMVAADKLQQQSICSVLGRWTAKSTARQLVSEAIASLETLIRLYYIRHSFERLDTFMVQPLAELAMIRQTDTGDSNVLDTESVQSTVVLCAQGFRDQGRNHYLGQALFHLTRNSVRPETRALIDKYLYAGPQVQVPSTPVLAHEVHSNWPLNIIDASENPKNQRLSDVLKNLGKITLDSSAEAP
ncbi:hypothetical protein MY11210_008515 [Beauveria gryllotalpidicola]